MIIDEPRDHTLEFLLAFDGGTHWYERGYHLRFRIRRVEPGAERPHGLQYAFTLHGPDGRRLVGFDNAHAVPARRTRSRRQTRAADHRHRTAEDPGRPYHFVDAETLLVDFFAEVERVLTEHGVVFTVVAEEEEGSP